MSSQFESESLEYTPTWALATVCFVIVSISIILEYSLRLLTNWLKRHRKKALIDAVEKLKSQLMLLGFLSLLLAVTQKPISNICIPAKFTEDMLPCPRQPELQPVKIQEYENFVTKITGNLSSMDGAYDDILRKQERILDEDESDANNTIADNDSCTSQEKVSLVAEKGIQQLHGFIFVLAVMQVVYSILTMALSRAKMRRWKSWEEETKTTEYQVANDPNRFRLTRQTTFGRRHTSSCTKTPVHLWIKSFFRQFNSVAKIDYFTLRNGFIAAHLSTRHNNFNFQKYIQRSLEEDFAVVISISPSMWFLVTILLLVDVHDWNLYLWIPYVPLLIVLVVGAKLQLIVTRMALEIKNQNNVIQGSPLVQPNDEWFWFKRPHFVLTLLHYALFVNAFDLAYCIWVTTQFGFNSCYSEHAAIIITRIVSAVTAQVLCSYVTLPLYALVTQMGSQFKSKALEEQTANIIGQWHAEVREKRKKQQQFVQSPIDIPSLPRQTSPSTKGEIIEEQENNARDLASASHRPPRRIMLELSRIN